MSSSTRGGATFALFVATTMLLSGCSADDSGGDCTEIGCSNQLTIRPLSHDGSVLKLVNGWLLIDGETVTINCVTTPSDDKVSCTSDGLVIRTNSADIVVKSLGSGDLYASDVTLKPVYAAVRPNGAGCEPMCQQAVLDLQLGGGLVDATGSDGGADAGTASDTATSNDSGATDAGATDAGSKDGGITDAGAADIGATDAGAMDAGSSDAGPSDANSADTTSTDTTTGDTATADTNAPAPGCCKADADCPKGNACVGSVCKDPSALKSGECWQDAVCKSGKCNGAVVCPCGASCFAPDKPGTCAPATTCSTINPTGYGLCDMIMGVGWDGKKCVNVSGCGCKEDCAKIFKTKAECESACTKTP